MGELDQLIAAQARDAAEFRVWSVSLDAFPDGEFQRPRVWICDERHGTLFGYVRMRCRCPKCRGASAEYQRDRRARDEDLRQRENASRRQRRARTGV